MCFQLIDVLLFAKCNFVICDDDDDDDDDDDGDAMACKWGMGAGIRRRAGWQNRTFFNTAQVHSCDDSPPDERERFAFYNGLPHGCISFVMCNR